MSTTQRTDTHRPSQLDPAEYELAAEGDRHPEEGWHFQVIETGAAADADTGHDEGQCQHCGHKGIRFYSVFLHVPTGETLFVGQDCAAKLNLDSRSAVQQKRDRERHAQEAKKAAWLAIDDHAELAEWLKGETERRFNEFLSSLQGQLNRKGELSEKQVEAVRKSKIRQAEWDAEREAEKADEPDPAPIPVEVLDGRAVITGKILGSKYKDSVYGSTLKMLVLDDRGFKVWGTQPDSLLVATDPDSGQGFIETADYPDDTPDGWLIDRTADSYDENGMAVHTPYKTAMCRPAGRGDRVTFTAKVEKSDRDEDFGFFSRPTKAEVVA